MEGRFQGAVCTRKKLVNGPALKIINTTNVILDWQATVIRTKVLRRPFCFGGVWDDPSGDELQQGWRCESQDTIFISLRGVAFHLFGGKLNTAGEFSCRFSFASIGVGALTPTSKIRCTEGAKASRTEIKSLNR